MWKIHLKKFKRGRVPWRKNDPRCTQLLLRNFFFSQHKPRRSTSHRYITSSLHLRVESMYTENSKYLPLATFHSIVKLLLTIPPISVLRAFSYRISRLRWLCLCVERKSTCFVASAKRFRLSLAPNQFRFHK